MSWVTGGEARNFRALMGLRPNLAADLASFESLLWQGPGVDPATLELCRLRIAGLHGARAALAEAFTPGEIVELALGVGLFLGMSKVLINLGLEPEEMPVTVIPTPGSKGGR